MSRRSALIYGGTFDPPHRGHIDLPLAAVRTLGLDELVYVPAAQNPHKEAGDATFADHRVNMLRLAIASVEEASLSTVEIDRGGPSYFVDTMHWFRDAFGPDADLRFLIGSDNVVGFHRWKDWREILQIAEPAVMLRPPLDRDTFQSQLDENFGREEASAWLTRIVDIPACDISATEIRDRLRSEVEHRDRPAYTVPLLDPAVLEYICEHDLYMMADANAS